MKKTFLKFFAAVLMVGFAAVSVGCKDYDDDIDALNSAVAGLQQTVANLQSKLDAGYLVTSINSTADGIAIALSNGQTYTVSNGKDGKPGTAWEIGEDGFWYKDGVKTEYPAVAGGNGENGAAGKDGKYYVPNPETGCFDEVDGDEVTETDIRWRPEGSGIVAVLNGNKLTLSNVATGVEGETTEVEISLGADLGNLALIPNVMHKDTGAEIISLYQLTNKVKDDLTGPANITGGVWSNAKVQYRLSPSNAYLPNDNFTAATYIGRWVKTRAVAGEIASPLVVDLKKTVVEDGVATIAVAGNTAVFEDKKNPIAESKGNIGDLTVAAADSYQLARLSVQIGTDQKVVSDELVMAAWKKLTVDQFLLAVTQKDGDWKADAVKKAYAWAKLANAEQEITKDNETNTGLYQRTKNSKDDTKSANVQQDVPVTAEVHMQVEVGQTYDLAQLIALFATQETAQFNFHAVKELGFDVTYEYSLPKEYIGVDKKTNDNSFVSLSGSKLTVLDRTSTTGRMPVVRVDAKIGGNLVATGYVKFEIINKKPVSKKVTVTLEEKTLNYADLTFDGVNAAGELNWHKINKEIFDALSTSHDKFVEAFFKSGKLANDAVVPVTTQYNPDGKKAEVGVQDFTWTTDKDAQDDLYIYAMDAPEWRGARFEDGFFYTLADMDQVEKTESNLPTMADMVKVDVKANGDSSTSTIEFSVAFTYDAYTQLTFEGSNEKGAKYTVKVVLTSADEATQVEIVLPVYVKQTVSAFEFIGNYKTSYKELPAVFFDGAKVNTLWKMEGPVTKSFVELTENVKNGKKVNLFDYYVDGTTYKKETASDKTSTYVCNIAGTHFNWDIAAYGTKVSGDADDVADVVAYWKKATGKSSPTLADMLAAGYEGPSVWPKYSGTCIAKTGGSKTIALHLDYTDASNRNMEAETVHKQMNYHIGFLNGERTADISYWVLFKNPFVAAEVKEKIEFIPTVSNSLDLKKYIQVVENNNAPKTVLSWYGEEKDKDGKVTLAEGLWFNPVLGADKPAADAANIYALYNGADKTTYPSELTGVTWSFDYDAPKDMTFDGLSSTFADDGILKFSSTLANANDVTVTVYATLTFHNAYVVTVEIPVIFKPTHN